MVLCQLRGLRPLILQRSTGHYRRTDRSAECSRKHIRYKSLFYLTLLRAPLDPFLNAQYHPKSMPYHGVCPPRLPLALETRCPCTLPSDLSITVNSRDMSLRAIYSKQQTAYPARGEERRNLKRRLNRGQRRLRIKLTAAVDLPSLIWFITLKTCSDVRRRMSHAPFLAS